MIEINGKQIDPQHYVDKWTNWALEATPVTDEQVTNNIEWLYKKAGLKKPEIKVFRNYEKFLGQDFTSVRDSIWASVRDSIWDSVRDSIWDSVGDSVGASVRASVRASVMASVWASVGDSVRASVGAWYWAEDMSFADVFSDADVLTKEKQQELQKYKEVLSTQRIAVFGKDICYVLVAPTIRRDDEGRLHSDQRCAVEWENETGQYYLDGVNLPKKLWQQIILQKMSLSEIMQIENADQRTVALKYNPQAIIKENATLLHKDNRSNELYLVENSEINKMTEFPKMYFLKMTCPTGRIFIEGVPPDEAEKNPNATAMQALLCGLTLSEYMSMEVES